MDADISPAFVPNRMDSDVAEKLIKFDNTDSAIKCFRNNRQYLSDYAYWFLDTAVRFALRRGVDEIVEYEIHKADVLAYFSRRKEDEILMLDKSRAIRKRRIQIVERLDGGMTDAASSQA